MPNNPHGKKSTYKKKQASLDREELIELLWCDLLNGVSRYQLMLKLERDAYVSQDGKRFETSKMNKSTRYDYIAEAYKNCEIELADKRDEQRKLWYERVLSIYNDCTDARDRQNALKALDMLNKMLGLSEPEQIDVNGKIKVNISFGLEDNDEEE